MISKLSQIRLSQKSSNWTKAERYYHESRCGTRSLLAEPAIAFEVLRKQITTVRATGKSLTGRDPGRGHLDFRLLLFLLARFAAFKMFAHCLLLSRATFLDNTEKHNEASLLP